MATVTLGNIKFNWKGAWNSGTAYVIDDVVSLSGSSYVSIQAGTNQNPASASAYWQQMSAAGTDGTDLTSTLTTQGDIVYRDGSGLARLGYGTAGQVLQTGGSGANPSWVDASSGGFNLIKTVTVSSSVSSVIFDNGSSGVVIDSTYNWYRMLITNLQFSSQQVMRARLRNGGSDYSASEYEYATENRDGSNNVGSNTSTGDTSMRFNARNQPYNTTQHTLHEIDFTITSGRYKPFMGRSGGFNGNGETENGQGGGILKNTGTVDGIKIFPNSGTIESGIFSLYGMSK